MPLTLVTGPANAAKAGFVLGAFREALERSGSGRLAAAEPVLVVPTAADVEPYQRELAATGAVFGGEVVTFTGLVRDVAARTGVGERPLGRIACDRVVRAVVAAARLELLAASAPTPGFPNAAARLFAELQRALVTPARFAAAMRDWAAAEGGGRRERYAGEVAGLYSAYRRRLEELGRCDEQGYAWAALDALRARPAAWGGRPVLFYGFDDLTPAQLDAVEAFVRVVGVDVTISLPYERGRAAFAGRAATVEALRPLAEADGRVLELPDRSEHYGPAARPALHHLERRLFEGGASRVPPNGAVRLLEAGGERAEAELACAAVLELLREGVAPGDIAVLSRTREEMPLLAQVLEAAGIAVERSDRTPLRHTRLGAGLCAYARAATDAGTAADVLTWLRTPGKLRRPELADELEARLLRAAATGAAAARAAWEEIAGTPLGELDALAGARGTAAFLDLLESELDRIWMRPHQRAAAILTGADAADARIAAEVHAACAELRGLAAVDARIAGRPGDVLEALEALEVHADAGSPGGVVVAEPAAVRARRFRAVLLCGLQDGAFPRRPAPEPFLDDGERRALAAATGLVLPVHEDVLAAERSLFYAAVSRAQEVLFLSYRSSDEEGEPQVASPFVDDVLALFDDSLFKRRGRRLLAEVTWPPAEAPTPLELRRSVAARTPQPEPPPLAAPAAPAVLEELAAIDRLSARELERFGQCGVRWLVESRLRPRRLEPDPEPMQRGSVAHRILERALLLLKERTGSARLSPGREEQARAALRTALDEVAATRAGARAKAALRALEVDLFRWLGAECAADTGMEPRHLEWSFDGLELTAGLTISGRVDRVDEGPGGTALVRDYKNSKGIPAARWARERQFQAGLYALAAREVLRLEPVGAVYQPLAGGDLRARGAVRDDAPAAPGSVGTDVLDAAGFEALLAELRALAVETAADLRAGRVAPCPERCTPRGCAYPGICRAREGAR